MDGVERIPGGQVWNGNFYPDLKKPGGLGIVGSLTGDTKFYHWEPGNCTRYEVMFTELEFSDDHYPHVVMTVLVPQPAAMVVTKKMDLQDLEYMREKMPNLQEGDRWALCSLINHHLEEEYG